MAPLATRALRHAALRSGATVRVTSKRVALRRFNSSAPTPPPGLPGEGFSRGRIIGLMSVFIVSGVAAYAYPILTKKELVVVPQAEIEFEKKRKAPVSKEENRDLISSQHLQVKKSWENPGVYAWGSNVGKVVAPDSKESVVKTPRRLTYFDGQILRDLKMDRDFGVAVTEKGDLVQWGTAFSKDTTTPTKTLTGKDIVKVELSQDRIIALSSGGSVYSVPVSKADQQSGDKQQESSGFWSSSSSIGCRVIQPASLGWNERVVDISSGLEHALLLTSKGRVFASASSSEAFPARGQMGIPGLTWATRPKGAYDQPHEIIALKGFPIRKIATGNFHSLALDENGKVFAFGDNSTGQLGFKPDFEASYVDVPSLVPLSKLYAGTGMRPLVTGVAAGGGNSYFTIDATKVAQPDDKVLARDLGRVSADVWACGEGIYGTLGTGRWTHVSSAPTKIKALSGLFEYDEVNNKVVPIRLAHLSVGSTHTSAIMDNVTNLEASTGKKGTTENDTNWGADIVWWGGNESYQLGTGKRNNASEPTYIGPLDGGKGDAEKGRKGEAHRFQISPRKTVRLGEGGTGRKVSVEQRVECGRLVTAVYSGT